MEALSSEPESETQVAILKGRNNYLCLHKLDGGYPEEEPDTLFDIPQRSMSRIGEEVLRLRSWAEKPRPATAMNLNPVYRIVPGRRYP